MREIPMMFKVDLVRQIEAGIKTQTRRPMITSSGRPHRIRAEAGDVILVRETWALMPGHQELSEAHRHIEHEGRRQTLIYRATSPDRLINWKPSILMPNDMVRLALRVTKRVEHPCHEMDPCDILAEGVGDISMGHAALRWEWEKLWRSIYDRCPHRNWEANPMLQGFHFEVIRAGQD